MREREKGKEGLRRVSRVAATFNNDHLTINESFVCACVCVACPNAINKQNKRRPPNQQTEKGICCFSPLSLLCVIVCG